MNNTPSIFAKRLRELRTDANLSMNQLAVQLNTSDSTISNWENDINEPTLSNILALANFFEVSTDYLLGVED